MIVKAAYGRFYNTAKEVKVAWQDGKDFVIIDLFNGCGRYVNRQDVAGSGQFVEIRYGKNDTKVLGIRA